MVKQLHLRQDLQNIENSECWHDHNVQLQSRPLPQFQQILLTELAKRLRKVFEIMLYILNFVKAFDVLCGTLVVVSGHDETLIVIQ